MSVDQKDKFTCFKCEYSMITVQREEGRVPRILPCLAKGCDGVMRSHFNNRFDVSGQSTEYELRFPTEEEAKDMDKEFLDRAGRGFLLPFKIEREVV